MPLQKHMAVNVSKSSKLWFTNQLKQWQGENFCGGTELELSHPHESLRKTTVGNQATKIKFKGSAHITHTHSLLDTAHMIVSFLFCLFFARN